MLRVMDDELPWIYGAARAAAASEAAALEATARVVRGAPAGALRRDLVADVVRLAMRSDPAEPFALLPLDEREALALVRLAGLGVEEVSAITATPADEVKGRLTSALRGLAAPMATAA